MTKEKIEAVLNELWPGSGHERELAVVICKLSAPANVTEEELVNAARTIKPHFRATTNYDDDVYWMGKSPFNEKWYIFASFGGVPELPAYICKHFPVEFENSDIDFTAHLRKYQS
jgi:hypothetical protein